MSQTSTASPIEEVVAFFAQGSSREEIAAFRLSDSAQKRVRTLLDKNKAGTLTPEDERELDRVMVLNEVVSLIRVRAYY